ncbi:hypothetical protein PAMP_004283 [Pampus punctatissimus]
MTRRFLQELVLDFHHPHQLKEGLEGFSLDLSDQPETLEQILVDCRDTLKYGVNTGHPRFFNQLSSGLDVIGVAGEWLTSAANTNMFTYEVSPVFILMEEVLLTKMQSIVGWSDDDGDGIFCPGGTISNLYSILVARYHFYPEVKARGMRALPQLVLFTSEHAAWGGGLLMSDRHRMKLQGIERAWSVTWNPHKMMGIPLQCSAILVRKRGLLQECNESGAEYLFQTDKPYDGLEGFGSQVNKCLENAEYLYDQLQRRTDFELVFKNKPEHSNVCFWYIPPSLRSLSPGADRDAKLHQVAPLIKGRMMEKGSVLIGYQPLWAKVNFFRCVFSNPATQQEDIDFLLEEIARLGNDL